MATSAFKRISDPVHGTIGLSELEARIIGTRAVQRLRNIKQLGLAYFVFPGANYSRLSHVLGVCHVTGQILSNLRASGTEVTEEEEQLYRLAGLLHDVGHYPFSHAMEEAVMDHYSTPLIEDGPTGPDREGQEPSRVLGHEQVGGEVLLGDSQISSILRASGLDPEAVFQIFARISPPKFSNLVSSDFDADRIDYLLRTAHHSGLPYGSVDLPYLLSQVQTDSEGRVCLTSKALKTADHFLLCRYFDYQQVTFHKTVAAFEWLLKDVIAELLRIGRLDCSEQNIKRLVSNGGWAKFDDDSVLRLVQSLPGDSQADAGTKEKAEAIMWRRPPKLIGEVEFLGQRDENTAKVYRMQRQMLTERIPGLARDLGISEKMFHLWSAPGMAITKIGSHVPISSIVEASGEDLDRYEQAVRILDSERLHSKDITSVRHSLMSVLSRWALYSLRLYVLIPGSDLGVEDTLKKKIREDLPHLEWK